MKTPSKIVSIFAGIYAGGISGLFGVFMIPGLLKLFLGYEVSLAIIFFVLAAPVIGIVGAMGCSSHFMALAMEGNIKKWNIVVIGSVVFASLLMTTYFYLQPLF